MRRLLLVIIAMAVLPVAAAHAARPTAADTVAAARGLGVGPQAAKLRDRFLRGARLVGHGRGGTRIGGRPDLEPAAAWPRCGGRPLSFLMQLDLGDLARAVPGATAARGTLSVFVDLDGDAQGLLTHAGRVRRGGCVAVLHSRRPASRLVRRAAPRGVRRLPADRPRLRETLTVPDSELADTLLHRRTTVAAADRWSAFVRRAAWGVLGEPAPLVPVHQVLGWAQPLQEDPTLYCGETRIPLGRRRLLIQFESGGRWDLDSGSGGSLMITIPARDLKAGRFDRLCAEMQED